MSKPNYASLLAQIAAETDPTAKAALEAQCYQFPEPLTTEEENLFNYVSTDYLEDTPGTTSSYIGIYYGEDGIIQ
jgi:hypothetical protein